MRVRDLRATLEGVRNVLKAARSSAQESAQEKMLSKVASSLEVQDDTRLESYLHELRRVTVEATEPLADRFARRLRSAELDEEKFKAVIQELQDMRQTKKLKKADAQKIAEAYAGSFDRRAKTEKLIDDIKRTFYEKLYERDSRVLAGRANPI